MALEIIRKPSRPLSQYAVRAADNLPYELRGLVVLPGYMPKDLTPGAVDLSAPLVRYKPGSEQPAMRLKIPVMSAAMQTVFSPRFGIALARMGGLPVSPHALPIDAQADQTKMIKRHKGAFVEPEVVAPDAPLSYVAERMRATRYSKFFVTEGGEKQGKLLGMITDNDFDEKKRHVGLLVQNRMRPFKELEVAYDDEIGYDVTAANDKILKSHHSALPVVYRDGRLRDVIFRRDIREHRIYENELVDSKKRLAVAAAVNTHDFTERVPKLVEADADILVVDTSQGHSGHEFDACEFIRTKYDGLPFIAGNIVTADGFYFVVEKCGAYAAKVGMGIGGACSTPMQIGVARSQDNALEEVTAARDEYFARTGIYIPVIADGGMPTIQAMLAALAFNADAVMLGEFLVGTDETPAEMRYTNGKPEKLYFGEASARAKATRVGRGYNPGFDEGFEKWVPYVGTLEPYLNMAMSQLRDGMRKAGCRSIHELHKKARIESISEKEAGMEKLSGRVAGQPPRGRVRRGVAALADFLQYLSRYGER